MDALVRRAARHYVAGPGLDDALLAAEALHVQQMACTVGYWDSGDEPPQRVRAKAAAAAAALAERHLDAYLSLKAPALGYDLGELPSTGVPLHLDALGPDTVDLQLRLADTLRLGITLPGRWRRSVQDAAAVTGLPVRVVKGQFPDSGPERDPRTGLLAVIEALVGRASFVAVATHDGALAAEALRRLRAAGTPCGWELLHGLPVPPGASTSGVPLRVYLPYGRAYLPYPVRSVMSHPRIASRAARDLLRPTARVPASLKTP
jgi:proline dehydrogenase